MIASADTERGVAALVEEAVRVAERVLRRPVRLEGSPRGGWVILDCGAVVLHAFRQDLREFYDLESLWGDAPRLRWRGD